MVSSTVYRGVLISGDWNWDRGIPLYIRDNCGSWNGEFALYIEVSSTEGVEKERLV